MPIKRRKRNASKGYRKNVIKSLIQTKENIRAFHSVPTSSEKKAISHVHDAISYLMTDD
jgi:hypothetical protein